MQRHKGYAETEQRDWVVARWVVWHQYGLSPFVKPAYKPRHPYDLLRLDGDPESHVQGLTPDMCHVEDAERKGVLRIFDKIRRQ